MAISTIPSAGITGGGFTFRNLIINGDMSIAQRGTSFSSQSSSAYHLDRFKTLINNLGTFTISQDTTVPTGQGFAKSFKLDCTTADASPAAGDSLQFVQYIEGQNLKLLKKGTSSAESLTVSFWVRSNKTGTYTLELYDNDNTRQISQTYTISSANTWEKKTVTFAGDTSGALDNDNGLSFAVQWWLGAGSDFTSGTLSETWTSVTTANRVSSSQVNLADDTANEWYITGVQLEVGTTASDFEFLPYDVNLLRCQRYYFQISGDTGDDRYIGMASIASSTQARCGVNLPTSMRTAPSVTEADLEVLDASGQPSVSVGFTINGLQDRIVLIANADSGTPFTTGQSGILRLQNLTSAYCKFDAEL